MEGPGFPLFPLSLYHYLAHGTVESTLPFMDVKYLPPRTQVIADRHM